jgi:hypothetical protein
MAAKKRKKSTKPEAQLVEYFQRNGYMRIPDNGRLGDEGSTVYKKGYEIRLVARTKAELNTIRKLLRETGLKAGKPFAKAQQIVQPIYGKAAMDQFSAWIEEFGE